MIGKRDCKFAVVGMDNADNFGLAQALRHIYGQGNVARFLSLDYVQHFFAEYSAEPIVIVLDLLGFEPQEATTFIDQTRVSFPKTVFTLFVDETEYQEKKREFLPAWQQRLGHYYKLYKVKADQEFEPMIRISLSPSIREAEYNLRGEPIRLTPIFQKGVRQLSKASEASAPIAFLSYSRADWDDFVSGLVSRLADSSQRVWIDQDYIVGGDDWMDAIGEALQVCDALLLVLSPASLKSKYVKYEYRYFLSQGKPIIPVLYQKVDKLPFELLTLHYIDFTRNENEAYNKLLNVFSRHRKVKAG